MRKLTALSFLGFLALIPAVLAMLPAGAQTPQQAAAGVATISASSGNVAAGTAAATIAANGQQNYLCGFSITSAGSTGATIVSATVTGLTGGTQTYTYATVAGVTLGNQPLVVTFQACLAATGPNVAITVSLPSLGAGNTNATVNAWGYRT